jgi:hypothetical protein
MPALNNKVREELMGLLREELQMVNEKAQEVAEAHWRRAEDEVARDLGYGDLLVRIEHLKNQIEGLQHELNHLEGTLVERARNATQQEYKSADIDVQTDGYGRVYRFPRVFGHEIKTYWDVLVLKHLNSQIPFFSVYRNLQQLHHAVRRELLLTGNFQEARELYQRFHTKITAALGNDIPGLLAEVQSIQALQAPQEGQL